MSIMPDGEPVVLPMRDVESADLTRRVRYTERIMCVCTSDQHAWLLRQAGISRTLSDVLRSLIDSAMYATEAELDESLRTSD